METPDTIHGRMKEGAHLAGYSLNRSIENLRWLLEDAKFEQLSAGYKNVNEFLRDTAQVFKLLDIKPEERKQIAELVKELQPKASQRAIADMVGVSPKTIGADLGVEYSTLIDEKDPEIVEYSTPPANPPDDLDPAEKLRKELKKDKRKQDRLFASETAENILDMDLVSNDIDVNDGDWWRLGNHLLYVGDTSSNKFYDRLPNDIAFTFADPPYGVKKAYWDGKFYWDHDYLIGLSDVVAVTPGIVSIFEFAKLTSMPYLWSMACWIDNGMTRGSVGFGNWIYIALFGNKSIFAQDQDIIRVSISNTEINSTLHESRKPAEMLVKLITMYSVKNDFVCDPFLGSGTTLFASDELGRNCIGGEINKEYCKEIIARWNKTHNDKGEKI